MAFKRRWITPAQRTKSGSEAGHALRLKPDHPIGAGQVEDLSDCVSAMYQLNIHKFGVPFVAEHTRGMMLRYPDRAEIYVRHTLNESWKRFTAVKELCHVMLDEEDDWSTDGVQTISDLQSDLRLSEVGTATSQSETLAELAAMELMYPFECREVDRRKIATGETTPVKIAVYHNMPTAMVERALLSSYHEVAGTLWDQIGGIATAAE